MTIGSSSISIKGTYEIRADILALTTADEDSNQCPASDNRPIKDSSMPISDRTSEPTSASPVDEPAEWDGDCNTEFAKIAETLIGNHQFFDQVKLSFRAQQKKAASAREKVKALCQHFSDYPPLNVIQSVLLVTKTEGYRSDYMLKLD